jgi:hypothetical protein
VPVCQKRDSCIVGSPYNLPDVISNLTSGVTVLGTINSQMNENVVLCDIVGTWMYYVFM